METYLNDGVGNLEADINQSISSLANWAIPFNFNKKDLNKGLYTPGIGVEVSTQLAYRAKHMVNTIITLDCSAERWERINSAVKIRSTDKVSIVSDKVVITLIGCSLADSFSVEPRLYGISVIERVEVVA